MYRTWFIIFTPKDLLTMLRLRISLWLLDRNWSLHRIRIAILVNSQNNMLYDYRLFWLTLSSLRYTLANVLDGKSIRVDTNQSRRTISNQTEMERRGETTRVDVRVGGHFETSIALWYWRRNHYTGHNQLHRPQTRWPFAAVIELITAQRRTQSLSL